MLLGGYENALLGTTITFLFSIMYNQICKEFHNLPYFFLLFVNVSESSTELGTIFFLYHGMTNIL